MVLQRYQIDADRFGLPFAASIPQVNPGTVLTPGNEDALYVEEYRFAKGTSRIDDKLINLLAAGLHYPDSPKMLRRQLAILSDEDFAYLARYALPVNAHNVLNEQKVADNLWYEETLPPDTLLYAGIAATDSRVQQESQQAADVMKSFRELFQDKPWLQVGGNETVGMGWCHVQVQPRMEP